MSLSMFDKIKPSNHPESLLLHHVKPTETANVDPIVLGSDQGTPAHIPCANAGLPSCIYKSPVSFFNIHPFIRPRETRWKSSSGRIRNAQNWTAPSGWHVKSATPTTSAGPKKKVAGQGGREPWTLGLFQQGEEVIEHPRRGPCPWYVIVMSGRG